MTFEAEPAGEPDTRRYYSLLASLPGTGEISNLTNPCYLVIYNALQQQQVIRFSAAYLLFNRRQAIPATTT